MTKLSRKHTIILVIFLIAVWGLNWPILKIALSYSPPILLTGMRTLLGGIVMLFIAIPRYKQLNLKQTWPIYVICSILNVILYHGLHTIGLNYMPSGLLAAIVFIHPVLVGIFAWLWLGESMYGSKIIGLIAGFLGVGIISGAGLLGHISLIGIVLALCSSLSWAFGTIYVKKIGNSVDSIWLVTIQFLIGGVVLTAVGSRTETWSDIDWNSTFIVCVLFSAIFVFALGWLVYFKLILAGEASKVSSYTFLIPTIAVLIGTLFMDEPFTISLIVGLVLILLGIYYVNRTPRVRSD